MWQAEHTLVQFSKCSCGDCPSFWSASASSVPVYTACVFIGVHIAKLLPFFNFFPRRSVAARMHSPWGGAEVGCTTKVASRTHVDPHGPPVLSANYSAWVFCPFEGLCTTTSRGRTGRCANFCPLPLSLTTAAFFAPRKEAFWRGPSVHCLHVSCYRCPRTSCSEHVYGIPVTTHC